MSTSLVQNIAVFGETGSGKTVLLSSFYGAAQEPQNIATSGFNVLAESSTQGTRLRQNFLGMKNSAVVPRQTILATDTYSFLIKQKHKPNAQPVKSGSDDSIRLVWHDYPGEWFEQDPSGDEEASRRVETFRSLLSSDVALLLVDGQRLFDNAGAEERYLKSFLTDIRTSLLLLRDDLLTDGKRLVQFPRIWILALSKADLHPNLTVEDFADLLVEKAGGDINELRDAIAGFVESSDALSVGEDFVLLSSAKFGSEVIETGERVGLDLVLPLAAVFPFERHLEWAQSKNTSKKVSAELMRGAVAIADKLGGASALGALLAKSGNKWVAAVGIIIAGVGPSLDDFAKWGRTQLEQANIDALAAQESLKATLIDFRISLDQAEQDHILLRRP